MNRILTILIPLLAPTAACPGFDLPASSSQCVIGIADDWTSTHATLQLCQKSGGTWRTIGRTIPARLGKNGLAWGIGLHPAPSTAAMKKEGDGKAPAGVFTLGGAWGYAPDITRHPDLPYRKVTPRDLWVEDPEHTQYNLHLILPHDPRSAWEKKQQMKQTDPAHALKLFIGHNSPPNVQQGMGSSIFFHIWRADGTKPTAGCTTMSASNLRELIAKIDPNKKPLYILLPRAEYRRHQSSWKLPDFTLP